MDSRVTIRDLVEHSYLKAGTVLTGETGDAQAVVTENGQLKIAGELFPFPSTAAKQVVGLGISVNGWEFWKLPSGDRLDVLRKRYRSRPT